MSSNQRDGVEFAQPRTLAGRQELAQRCAANLGLTMPLLVDGLDNAADRAYQAWPERLYVISLERRVAYQGGKGPYGFDPGDLERFLTSSLNDAGVLLPVSDGPRRASDR